MLKKTTSASKLLLSRVHKYPNVLPEWSDYYIKLGQKLWEVQQCFVVDNVTMLMC